MSTGTYHLRANEKPGPKGKPRVSHYYAEFREPHRHPQRKRVSLRTASKAEAVIRFGTLTREYVAGLFDPWAGRPSSARREGVPFDDAAARFVEAKRRDGVRARTVEGYAGLLRTFGRTLPDGIALHAVEARHVEAFTGRAGLADASRRTYRRSLGVFFAWAVVEGLTGVNPVATPKGRSARTRKDLPEYLTEDDAARLLRAIEADAAVRPGSDPDAAAWLHGVVRFAVGTGLRLGEIVALRWSAVNLADGFVKVANTDTFTTKSGRERVVYLTGDARAVVEGRAAARRSEDDAAPVFTNAVGRPLNPAYVSRRFRFFRQVARLPENIHFHSLRHTFASWAVMRGVDIYTLKDILGHSDVTVTQRYAHLRPDGTRGAMLRAFGAGLLTRPEDVDSLRAEIARLRALLDAAEGPHE